MEMTVALAILVIVAAIGWTSLGQHLPRYRTMQASKAAPLDNDISGTRPSLRNPASSGTNADDPGKQGFGKDVALSKTLDGDDDT